MPHVDTATTPAPVPVPAPAGGGFGQTRTASRFAVRDLTRNRLAGLLLLVFVPAWYLLMSAFAGHQMLTFRLFATGRILNADGQHLTLISAGLNDLSMIVGFTVFDATRQSLTFDKRLVFAGMRQGRLIGAKILAVMLLATGVAVYTAGVLLVFWRPSLAGWLAITTGFTAIALTYGAFGLLLGVLVKGDLEGFFLIIMGGLTDTFLQNPLGNPLANKPILEWFPSFGPMQFAVGGSLGHTALWSHLGVGFAWAAGFSAIGLIIFRVKTQTRTHLGRRRSHRGAPVTVHG